jgi:hypothetical protein
VALSARELWAARQRMQIVFQDPFGSLNPRMRVGSIIAEPLQIYARADAAGRRRRTAELLEVGRPQSRLCRALPARALGRPAPAHRHRGRARPAAEPHRGRRARLSALDVSIQAQVLNLLMDLRRRFGLTLSVHLARSPRGAAHVGSRGRDVPRGDRGDRLARHDPSRGEASYTQVLLSAVPVADPAARRERIAPKGEVASPLGRARGLPLPPALFLWPSTAAASSARRHATSGRAISLLVISIKSGGSESPLLPRHPPTELVRLAESQEALRSYPHSHRVRTMGIAAPPRTSPHRVVRPVESQGSSALLPALPSGENDGSFLPRHPHRAI